MARRQSQAGEHQGGANELWRARQLVEEQQRGDGMTDRLESLLWRALA